MYQLFIFQLNSHYDGYISIEEIDSNENSKLITKLTGSDTGPKSEYSYSNWKKKIISSSTNKIIIMFKSDNLYAYKGFSANILFSPVPSEKCKSWLDMNKKTFASPNYPKSYQSNMKCSWLITVGYHNHITLNILELHVRYQNTN